MASHSTRPEQLRDGDFPVHAASARGLSSPQQHRNWAQRWVLPGIRVALGFCCGQECPRAGAGFLVLFFLFEATCSAQTFGAMKGFKVAEPYPTPNEKQTKSRLEAGQALPVRSGYLLSEGVTLWAFSESNTLQLVVRGQECFYSASNHTVNSSGPIQMQTADGKFSIEGVGFYWLQTNSSLFISNQVHTLILAELLQSATNQQGSAGNPDMGPLTIWSDRFHYDGASGLGIWSEHVQVIGTNATGTNLALSSELLTAEVPMKQRQVRSLLAEGNVVIDYNGLHGTGARLNYAPDTGLIRLWDHAAWTAQKREGRGDELIIDRSNQVFQVNGHAWLNLPGQSIGETGFLSFSNTPAQGVSKAEQRSVEITCRRYEIRTNSAIFYDQVQLREHWNGTVRGRMSCQLMTASFVGTNELQNIVADKNVVIEQGEDKRFTGGHAVYTHTNTTLEITEKPEWRDGARSGKGELLRLNTDRNEMLARGNAWLRLPANQLAGQLSFTNHAAVHPSSLSATNQFADIYCQEYTLQATNSVFRGGVYATHPEMNCTCEQMTVWMPSAGLTNVISEGNVVFDLLTQQGKTHGTGDNAVYSFGVVNTATNGTQTIDQLKLTGTPAVLSTTNRTLQDLLIIWDRLSNKVVLAGGNYKMQGSGRALSTNTFQLPNKKLTK
jgi:lipopolysaccharide export system protein LptA